MQAYRKSVLDRLQSLLPLKGRWLRYFLWGLWLAAGYVVILRADILGCWGLMVIAAFAAVIRSSASDDTPPGD